MFRPSSIVFRYSFYQLLFLWYLVVFICCIQIFSIFAVRVLNKIQFSSVQFSSERGRNRSRSHVTYFVFGYTVLSRSVLAIKVGSCVK